jgi:xanthine dehydrogenase accessory factor
MPMIVIVRGGGDLASGVVLRLHRVGLRVAVTELPQPLAVRRCVSFAEAVYEGECSVEEIGAKVVKDPTDTLRVLQIFGKNLVPVLIDPGDAAIKALHPAVVVDARMLKERAELIPSLVKLIIGLGPGFVAGENCHAVVETNRGHNLGRLIWSGGAEPNTGAPEAVGEHRLERVLRAPADGVLEAHAAICDRLKAGQVIAEVAGQPVLAPFDGILRGLIHPGIQVTSGMKIGDVDPRDDPSYCTRVSDKSLAIAGGVLEAILSRVELRPLLWA